jgi:hypothetical protein
VQPTCGARCGITLVYRFIRGVDEIQTSVPFGDYFHCETTVSTLSGAKQPLHHMADTLAIRLASAIAIIPGERRPDKDRGKAWF